MSNSNASFRRLILAVAFEFDSSCGALWGAPQLESNSNASFRRRVRSFSVRFRLFSVVFGSFSVVFDSFSVVFDRFRSFSVVFGSFSVVFGRLEKEFPVKARRNLLPAKRASLLPPHPTVQTFLVEDMFATCPGTKNQPKTIENEPKTNRKRSKSVPKTIENSAENDRKRRRNEAFEFDSNCQAP